VSLQPFNSLHEFADYAHGRHSHAAQRTGHAIIEEIFEVSQSVIKRFR